MVIVKCSIFVPVLKEIRTFENASFGLFDDEFKSLMN
jgi:hypothetical protein